MKKINSENILTIDTDENRKNVLIFLKNKLNYIRDIIQKTILSIKTNKMHEIFSENDAKLSITILTELYEKNEEINTTLLREDIEVEEIMTSMQQVLDKLSMIICGFGTKNIVDLLFVSFGSEFKNQNPSSFLIKEKYELVKKFFHPTGYKLIHWKLNHTIKEENEEVVCINKQTEDNIDLVTNQSYECYDIDNENSNLIQKMNSIRIVIHNKKARKTLIITGMLDDIHIECVSNPYIKERVIRLNNKKEQYNNEDKAILETVLENLSLKELLVYGDKDILKKLHPIHIDVIKVKQTNIDLLTKQFLEMDMYIQRSMLLNLLFFKKDKELEYICYLLYDLLNSATCYNSKYQDLIYNSFPWKIRNEMKDIVKYNITYTQDTINKYEYSKISLEQQICLLKADDSVKEKAMIKLKELKGRPDELGTKIKQYLEGLIHIPFNIYKKEPILTMVDDINNEFINIQDFISTNISSDKIYKKNKYTLLEISKYIKNYKIIINTEIKHNFINKISDLSIKVLNCVINILVNDKNKRRELLKENKVTKITTIKDNILENKEINLNIFTNICENIEVFEKNKDYIIRSKQVLNIEKNINKLNVETKRIEDALDESVYSHNHAKNQIMKIIGQWINGEQTGYCFGFEGSPGIGKTSLAKKGLTNCLLDVEGVSRPFSFIAIGGSSSGSSLEGHSYTYVNSTWGKIVDILMETKCMNPIIYIDELDKVSNTENGKEIIGILTHLIDPTQNDSFQDKYFTGIDIDISKALFIFSYNDPDLIDRVLLDRIHRIKFENLTLEDKMVIIDKYIIPEMNKKMGFENIVTIKEDVIEHIIVNYTSEPGVRKLKEIMFDLYGEINLELLRIDNNDNNLIPINITIENLEKKYLTKYNKIKEKKIHEKARIGIINGLWANVLGMGGIIPIQTSFYPSSVFLDLQLTGLQGDVMKESMNVAKTLAWSLTDDDIKENWLEYFKKTKCQGLHIHCPEGSTSKDGPSAGTAITIAIYSLLNKKKIRNDVAITGEITLSGEVTAIGGLSIKINNGIRAGINTILYPEENKRDFLKWEEKNKVKNNSIKFIEIATIQEVFNYVFTE